MSILIKGMEMPKSCDNCPCYYETEGAWRNECQVLQKECAVSEKRPFWCPLVEIPPHGDLIDRDEQIERAWRLNLSTRELIEEMLKTAPTIIEAEEGE